jgi:hypothetical protein
MASQELTNAPSAGDAQGIRALLDSLGKARSGRQVDQLRDEILRLINAGEGGAGTAPGTRAPVVPWGEQGYGFNFRWGFSTELSPGADLTIDLTPFVHVSSDAIGPTPMVVATPSSSSGAQPAVQLAS